jgi:hypothetical protein
MPDNIAVTPGTGATVSTEEITTLNGGAVSAQHVQRIIPAIRTADGTAVDVTTAAPMPISDGGGSLTVDGTLSLSGEAHIGQTGGATVVLTNTPVITTTAYTAGDQVGAKFTLTNALRISSGTGAIVSLSLVDLGNQKAALDLIIFDADFTAGTDNAAWAWNTADYNKVLGVISIAAADYVTIGGEAIATKRGLSLLVAANGTANLYGVLVTSGTPTYTSTTDLRLRLGLIQD